jgi:hypothetical protein
MELSIPTMADFKQLVQKVDEILNSLGSEVKPPSEGWMKSTEVCSVLQCSPSTLKNYRDKNTIEWKKIGGTFYYKSKI